MEGMPVHNSYVPDDRPTRQGTALGERNGLPLSMGSVTKLVRTQLIEFLVRMQRFEFPGLTKTGLFYIYGELLASAFSASQRRTPKTAQAKNGWISPRLTLVLMSGMNNFFFANKIRFFANFGCFFTKWGLFFAKWGLFFASLYVRKSPAVLLNLGHPIAPLRFVCAI